MKRATPAPVSVLRWEEPPAAGPAGASSAWIDEAVEALRHAPGTWALLRAGAKGFGPAQVKRAREMHPECEFVARKIAGEDGELVGAVYGRFVGEPEDAGVEPDESQAEEDDDEDGKGDARRRIADQVAREREKRRKAPNAAL